jgi:hypothetical protein
MLNAFMYLYPICQRTIKIMKAASFNHLKKWWR